jgi:phage shock protein A
MFFIFFLTNINLCQLQKGELPPGRAAVSNSGAARPFPDLEIESELNELRRKAKEY